VRVLLVEDNRITCEAIKFALTRRDIWVESTPSGDEGWFQGSSEDFDAIILDLNLPELDGLTILKRWREEGIQTPVLILTCKGKCIDRVRGINTGADDYLPKPFQMAELVARLNAIIRRSKGASSSQVTCGDVSLNLLNGTIMAHGKIIDLAPLERRALTLLMQERGKPVPSHELFDHVYGLNSTKSPNALEALIKRLRAKLPRDFIRTRRGIGYMIPENDNSAAPVMPVHLHA